MKIDHLIINFNFLLSQNNMSKDVQQIVESNDSVEQVQAEALGCIQVSSSNKLPTQRSRVLVQEDSDGEKAPVMTSRCDQLFAFPAFAGLQNQESLKSEPLDCAQVRSLKKLPT